MKMGLISQGGNWMSSDKLKKLLKMKTEAISTEKGMEFQSLIDEKLKGIEDPEQRMKILATMLESRLKILSDILNTVSRKKHEKHQ